MVRQFFTLTCLKPKSVVNAPDICCFYCRANMRLSVVVLICHVMDVLMSVKDLPSTCQG